MQNQPQLMFLVCDFSLILAYFLHKIGQNVKQNKFLCPFSEFEPINSTKEQIKKGDLSM